MSTPCIVTPLNEAPDFIKSSMVSQVVTKYEGPTSQQAVSDNGNSADIDELHGGQSPEK